MKKFIHQIDIKWTVAPFSKFDGKTWVGFCLNTGKQFFHFQANRNNLGPSKNYTRDFQNSSPFEISACFNVTITGDFERFQYFNFETILLKRKPFSQKVCVLVENTKIENASFPHKTALSEANVSQIEWQVQNGPITENGFFTVTTFFFKNIVSV